MASSTARGLDLRVEYIPLFSPTLCGLHRRGEARATPLAYPSS
ncbi:hypothetical protein HMPREF1556_00901 [Porphyromonas sp. oral taxon 278 str. W7784]|nr:hypothetical protein HMPREF1556_00901 [Porphyromonas sp. oral taxon 278 str. W7784]